MNLSKYVFKTLAILLFTSLSLIARTNKDDDKGKSPSNTPNTKATSLVKVGMSSRSAVMVEREGVAAPSIVQSDLDEAVERLQHKLADNAIVEDNLANVPLNLTSEAAEDRLNAEKLFRYLDNNKQKVYDLLKMEHLVQLPVGIRFPVTKETDALLGILKVEFKPDHAELTVFLRYKFHVKDSNSPERDLFLGAEGIHFTKEGGLQNTFKVSLLGDFTLPMGSWSLIMKGGMGVGDQDYSKTFAEINCGDLVGGSVQGQIVFPTSVIKPYNEVTRTAITDGSRVMLDINASYTKQSLLKDIMVGATFSQPFCVAGFEKWGFKIQDAYYDHSDTRNPINNTMPFPTGYTGITDNTWKGIYLGKFEVLLPKAFKKYGSEENVAKIPSCNGTSLGGRQILIDPSGFSGSVYYSKSTCSTPAEDVSAQKWKLTLDEVSIDFVQNSFQKGTFKGRVAIPLTDPELDGQDAMLEYAGLIDLGGKYSLDVKTASNIPYKFRPLRASGKFYTGSWVKLEVIDDTFYPSCNLSGEFSIASNVNASVTHSTALPNSTAETDAKFTGLRFYNLNFQTKDKTKPIFQIGDFSYDNPEGGRILSFPVSLTWLKKYSDPLDGQIPGQNDLWIGLGLKANLGRKDAIEITGSTKLIFRTTYNTTKGRLELSGVTLMNLYVKGDGPALYVEGSLIRGESALMNEFKGQLRIAIKKPTPFGIECNAIIGHWKGTGADACSITKEYNYGYIDCFVGQLYEVTEQADGNLAFKKAVSTAPTIIPAIPTGIGDLFINGAGVGIYWNMKPFFNPEPAATATTVMKYEACYQVPFGIKGMIGYQGGNTNKPPYRGRLNLDISFDRTYGINQIAFHGNLVVSSDFSQTFKLDALESLTATVKNKTQQELANFVPEVKDLKALSDKASQQNVAAGVTSTNQEKKLGSLVIVAGAIFDIPNMTYHLEGFARINQGKLTGYADAVLHIGKENITSGPFMSYLRVGKPYPTTERAFLAYRDIGAKDRAILEANGYLWIGSGVPAFPMPPEEILRTFPSLRSRFANINYAAVRSGAAIALGAMGRVDIFTEGWAGSVQVNGVAGFDVLLSNNSTCNNNGFYGQGQLYGLVDIYAKSGPFKARVGAGLYFYANFFKPFGTEGCVYIRIKTPWYLPDIKLNPCFTLGTICKN